MHNMTNSGLNVFSNKQDQTNSHIGLGEVEEEEPLEQGSFNPPDEEN
jgi:hypothetical protein